MECSRHDVVYNVERRIAKAMLAVGCKLVQMLRNTGAGLPFIHGTGTACLSIPRQVGKYGTGWGESARFDVIWWRKGLTMKANKPAEHKAIEGQQ